jgi:4-hydroxy-4-methyl-2-oxoglutarate aldolase
MFSCHVSVSHAYVHMVDYGTTVSISGLEITSGDLLMADCHGVLSIPRQIAPELASVARELIQNERVVIDLCASPDFTIEKLRTAIETL